MPGPLADLAHRLAEGTTTSRALVDRALANIAATPHVFIQTDADGARAAADAVDEARGRGEALPEYAGVPISIKDLFDIRGQVTRAGSMVLGDAPPADHDAPVIARLRAAGFLVVGRTNMTEFAYSGVGLNPHYGTPANPYGREAREGPRIPGGSSSGAAVSVTDGMAAAGIGTDTGGSCRIPAAMCGIVGFKPTAARVDRTGAFPLSRSLDSIGSLARTVDCCVRLDAIMADGPTAPEAARDPATCRLGVLTDYVTNDLEPEVAAVCAGALTRLAEDGFELQDVPFPELCDLPDINAKGGLAAAEAFHHHRALIERAADRYDPRVSVRIQVGAGQSAADYLDVLDARARLIAVAARRFAGFDAIVLPTVPMIAPLLSAFADDEEYARLNLLALRNPSVGNFLDGCAISLPAHRPGGAPVGLSLMGLGGSDARILAVARAVEGALVC